MIRRVAVSAHLQQMGLGAQVPRGSAWDEWELFSTRLCNSKSLPIYNSCTDHGIGTSSDRVWGGIRTFLPDQ